MDLVLADVREKRADVRDDVREEGMIRGRKDCCSDK